MYLLIRVPNMDFPASPPSAGLPVWLAVLSDEQAGRTVVPAEALRITMFHASDARSHFNEREQLIDHMLVQLRAALEQSLHVPFKRWHAAASRPARAAHAACARSASSTDAGLSATPRLSVA